MNEYLKKELMNYMKTYIKRYLNDKFYDKEKLLEEIDDIGLNDWQEVSTNYTCSLIELLENDINDFIRYWCKEYQYNIDKDLILDLTTADITFSARHTFFNNIPQDFPYPKKLLKHKNMGDLETSNVLGFLRIPLKEFINYTEKEIESLPIYSKLKDENKQIRKIIIKNYIEDINNYLENLE